MTPPVRGDNGGIVFFSVLVWRTKG
uniref:Uncharacterized protein n=1 Tax=Anguilla anguilla TaxID=7936 RepID=A0A0E9P790_ANGAN